MSWIVLKMLFYALKSIYFNEWNAKKEAMKRSVFESLVIIHVSQEASDSREVLIVSYFRCRLTILINLWRC